MLITNNQKPGLRKHTVAREITFGPLSLRFITIIVIAALCILYLAQSTQGATKNYHLRELEQQQVELEKENKRLEIEVIRLQALQSIDATKNQEENQNNPDKNGKLIPDDTPEYIE